jgi:hypothetical protein
LVLVAIWIAALGMAGVLGLIGYEIARAPRTIPRPQRIERPLRTESRLRWTMTEQRSAHHVFIAHVETSHLDEAVAITQQIVEPVKTRYAEALVYFHRPGRPDTLPPRRVQWTRANGYVETVYR